MTRTCIALVLSYVMAGCGGRPGAPSELPAPSLPPVPSLVSTPVSPANGAIISAASVPVTLVAESTSPSAGHVVLDVFEVSEDPLFRSVSGRTLPRGTGRTSLVLEGFVIRIDQDYYWRVRGVSGDDIGPNSETFRFRVVPEGLRAPELVAPLPSSPQAHPVTLVIRQVLNGNPLPADWSYGFQVARDASFSVLVQTAAVRENPTDITRLELDRSLPAGEYFWRVQTIDQHGNRSAFSETRAFRLGERFVSTPALISPPSGSVLPQPITLTVGHAPHSGNPIDVGYEMQVATNPLFDAEVKFTGDRVIGPTSSAVIIRSPLPPGTYYWRARMIHPDTNRPEIVSAWTPPWSFSIGQSIDAPRHVFPASGATVYPQPILIVDNSARTGIAGSLSYRFEISTTSSFRPGETLATAMVTEGPGQTPWQAPAPLPVGIPLWWRVQARDPASGTTSPWSMHTSFTPVGSSATLYTLSIQIPAECAVVIQNPRLAATSESPRGAGPFDLRTTGPLFTNNTLTLDAVRTADGLMSGSIGGAAAVARPEAPASNTHTLVVALTPSGAGRAALTGRVNGDGTMSGTFSGHVRFFPSRFATGGGECSSTAFTWSVTPRA